MSTAVDQVSAGQPPRTRAQTNLVFVTILLGMLLAALDQTIVSTALPTIVADLGGSGHMAWVVTAYLLAETVASVLVGKFGDLFGRKIIFQISAVVFVGGSVIAGASNSMLMLIAARAVQGIGGGGLMVTAMALIADVIPLRERGKYQGALGAVFGVTTVVGPTLGGVFTDHASWRWCFYVNVPVAVIMLVMTASTIPSVKAAVAPIIDYLGIALVAAGSCGLILALEWGGHQYAWGSATIVGLFAGSALLLAVFVVVEVRAPEPVLPMHLFRSQVFTVCSILSFIVGFAMLGVITFLPTYLQYVNGASATLSGIRTLPLVVGLLLTSTLSGNVVSRTGKYRIFPIAGTAVIAVGLYLMSTMDARTSAAVESAYMFVVGLGIGLAMQVLTIVVQNTVAYRELGSATSGVTFFRTLGSSFGTAIFGTLYTSQLGPNLAKAVAQSPRVPPAAVTNPMLLHRLPAASTVHIVDAYAQSLNFVFRWAIPVAAVGFVVAWFLKQVPMRDSARAGATSTGDGFQAPDRVDADRQLELAVSRVLRNADRQAKLSVVADSGTTLTPGQAWMLGQVYWRGRYQDAVSVQSVARAHKVPPEIMDPAFRQFAGAGYVDLDDGTLTLTPAGQAELHRLAAAWRQWLDSRLEDWTPSDPADRARLERAIDHIATRLFEEEQARNDEQVSV